MTITEFLLARIAEDEAAARRVDPDFEANPVQEFIGDRTWIGKPWALDITESEHAPVWAVLIQTKRVLAECEAKRRITELHPLMEGPAYRQTECCARCTAHGEYPADDEYTDERNWPCPTLRALAAVYADHPDYDEAWRP